MRSQIAAVATASTLLATVLTTTGAQAQVAPGQVSPGTGVSQQIGQHAAGRSGDDDASKKVKANDKAYDAALKNLPNKQYDPWHGVR
jgi:hypothetical protein